MKELVFLTQPKSLKITLLDMILVIRLQVIIFCKIKNSLIRGQCFKFYLIPQTTRIFAGNKPFMVRLLRSNLSVQILSISQD